MAVHAQYVSQAFAPDFQTITTTTTTRIPTDNNNNNNNGLKDQQLIGQHTQIAVLSSQNSDLTCNAASASPRKRSRDTASMFDQQFQFPIPTKIQPIPNYQQSRLLGSAGTSTSCRPILPPQSQHSTEFDQLISLHSTKIISGIHEIQKRHYIDIIRIFETQSAKKIAGKDAEIETLKRTHAELEARLKQVTAENQVWFNVARNSESLVAGLKGSLDQALHRRGGECHTAEDAESCCYEGDDEDRRRPVRGVCRVCNENSVSVLVLPCRHLCLCLQCEPVSETCPICYGAKNVGLQVFME